MLIIFQLHYLPTTRIFSCRADIDIDQITDDIKSWCFANKLTLKIDETNDIIIIKDPQDSTDQQQSMHNWRELSDPCKRIDPSLLSSTPSHGAGHSWLDNMTTKLWPSIPGDKLQCISISFIRFRKSQGYHCKG